METVAVRVQLFGALRAYGSRVSLDVPRGTTVAKLRAHLVEALRRGSASFAGHELVNASVLADEDRILDESHEVGGGAGEVSLAALPPVCGG